MNQNNHNTKAYGDPAPGSYTSQHDDATIFESFRLVQEYLDEEARGGNNDVNNQIDDEDDEYYNENDDSEDNNEIGNSHAANEQDVNYNGMNFDEMDFNQEDPSLNDINFGFDMTDSLYPSSPTIIKSTPLDEPEGEDDGDLFGEPLEASPASHRAPAPAAPSVMSALSFPQADPATAASHPLQAPGPSVPHPTLTFPQLDSAELSGLPHTQELGPVRPDYTLSVLPIDPLITADVPSAAQPSARAGVSRPQPYPSQPETTGLTLAVPNSNLYFPDQLDNILPNTTNASQGQYPLGPLLGQGNRASQPARGQGGYGDQYQHGNQAYGNSPYAMTPAQQRAGPYDMYSNTQVQQQFVSPGPSRYRQSTGPQNPGHMLSMPQNISPSMNLADVGRLNPFDLRAPAPNQPIYPPQPNSLSMEDQPHPLNRGRISHRRSRKASSNNDTLRFYVRPPRLASWGPLVPGPRQPEPVFRYYKHFAELRPALTFSTEQIITFLRGTGHPYPGRRLTLWVQNVAAQSNDRYANGGASTKCRYKHCPASQNTILKGFFRIAFDEFSDRTGESLDPMQNAGYMHLHCFEKMFDLGYLIHHGAARLGFRILPDRRVFAHETKNSASITRDHNDMGKTYDEWVEGQRGRANYIESVNQTCPPDQLYTGLAPRPDMIPPHSQRLGFKLVRKHLDMQVKGRAVTRDNRGGPHIGVHQGDLDLLVHLKRRPKKTAPPPAELETQQAPQQGGQLEVQQGGKLQLLVQPQQQVQQEAQPATANTETAGVTQDRTRKRARDDSDEEYSPSSDEQRPRQRQRTHSNTLQFSSRPEPPRYQTRGESEATRGTKRAIDDLESSSTSPDSIAKRARRDTRAYQTPDSLPREHLYSAMPLSAYQAEEDSIHVAFGDEDEDEETGLGFRGPQPDWYSHTPPTVSPATTTTTTPTPTPHHQPQPQPQQPAHPHPHPHTRSRSRQDSASILDQLTTPTHHLTRASAHAIQSQLEAQPAHVREQVLAAVPAEYAALVQPPTSSPTPTTSVGRAGGGGGRGVRFEEGEEDGMRVRENRLEERVVGLEADQRREVERAVVKEERKGKEGARRKVQSL